MRDAAGQLAERFHLLRLRQLLARLLERQLRFVLHGDVAHQFGEADQLAVLVADRVHHHAGEKPAAVLAHQPGLALELAMLGRRGKRLFAEPGGALFLGQENIEVPADNLAGAVALDAAGALVPTADAAIGVEHIDGVVAHALEQKSIILFAVAQRHLGLAPRGDVETDAEHADRRAVLVAHHFADALQMTHAAVGPHDALFMAEVGAAAFQRRADAFLHALAVVRMQEADEVLDLARRRLPCDAIDVHQLVRPGDLVVADVPRPAAEIGEALRFGEMDIGVGQSGGAFLDAGIEFDLRAPQIVLGGAAHRRRRRSAPATAPRR